MSWKNREKISQVLGCARYRTSMRREEREREVRGYVASELKQSSLDTSCLSNFGAVILYTETYRKPLNHAAVPFLQWLRSIGLTADPIWSNGFAKCGFGGYSKWLR